MTTEISINKPNSIHPSANYKSLFLFVVEHLDKSGKYDGSPLPDNPMRGYAYGAEDAALFHPYADNTYMEEAKDIYLLLKEWMKKPNQANKNRLYEKICTTPQITVFFTLASQLRGEKLSYDLLHLAQEWFYTAKDREAVKFTYLICGLIGLEQVRRSFSENLYKDLFTMARCEEFTIFLCLACQLSEIRPQKELWFLARHTEGWGKAVLLLTLQYRTPTQQRWLLKKGMDMRIFWPPLSPLVIKESLLPQMLKAEEIPEDIYQAAANVILAYLLFLAPGTEPLENPLENAMMTPVKIALEPLMQDFLRHAKTHAVTPRELLSIYAVKDRLEALATEIKGAFLTANAAQLLIAQCDSLIYCKDWEPEIRASLFNSHGRLNTDIVDFAADLDIDIWPDVIRYYNDHPKDHTALRYLMFTGASFNLRIDSKRRHLFLDCAESHLKQYKENEDLLVNFAHFLKDYPGEGEAFLEAGLTSIYEQAIGMAALSLSMWPREQIPMRLKKAVVTAMQLNHDPFIEQVLESIIDEKVPAPFEFGQGDEV